MRYAGSALLLLCLDRGLKWLAWNHLLTAPFFSLFLNQGIIFSWSLDNRIATLLIGLIIGGLVYKLKRGIRLASPYTGAWWLVLTGAVSNLYDRLVYGGVIDYVTWGWWPVFNLADLYIFVGAFYALIIYGQHNSGGRITSALDKSDDLM